MNKAELIERIINTFTDMGSEDPEDTAMCGKISLEEATMYLGERRAMERADLEPDEWLPVEVTPELYMEAENCYIRKCRYDVTKSRLADFFTLREVVDCYHEFDGEYHSDTDKYVIPTDWLTESIEFPFTSHDLTMLDLIQLGQNSPDFNPIVEFCWYDAVNKQLHSTSNPFYDGLIDASAFATWILEDPERIQCVQDDYMDNTDIDFIFNFYK